MGGRGYLKKRLEELKKLKEEADKSMNQQNVNGHDHNMFVNKYQFYILS